MGGYRLLDGKVVIGLSERITIKNSKGKRTVEAKIDTGATKSSIDVELAKQLHLGPVITSKMVKSAHGYMLRPVVKATIAIAGKTLTEDFTLADKLREQILESGYSVDDTAYGPLIKPSPTRS